MDINNEVKIFGSGFGFGRICMLSFGFGAVTSVHFRFRPKRKNRFRSTSIYQVCSTRCARRCSQAAINRRRKLSLCAAPKHLRLYDFIKQRNSRPPPSTSGINLRLGTVSVSINMQFLFWLELYNAQSVLCYMMHHCNIRAIILCVWTLSFSDILLFCLHLIILWFHMLCWIVSAAVVSWPLSP